MKKILLFFLAMTAVMMANPKDYTILISFDGFRWDYVHRDLTPNIARMAREGVSASSLEPVFPSKTFPNHLSIVTGMYPENHGIIMNSFSDPATGETYRLGDSVSVRDPKWYIAEAIWETAERNGVRTASYFWPGSELNGPRRPYYRELYDHERPYGERIDGILKWLQLPEAERPRFLTLYFHETDSRGHRYGPDSPEVNRGIAMLDSLLGVLVDGLGKIGMLEQTNIILTSDHGMTNVGLDRIIDVSQVIRTEDFTFTGYGPVMMIAPKPGTSEAIYKALKSGENHYKVYWRDEMPPRFHFSNHPFISEII
nr:ectonucleotide pyrophosphatase/phosphodiesterase [Calditrichia bacterium]